MTKISLPVATTNSGIKESAQINFKRQKVWQLKSTQCLQCFNETCMHDSNGLVFVASPSYVASSADCITHFHKNKSYDKYYNHLGYKNEPLSLKPPSFKDCNCYKGEKADKPKLLAKTLLRSLLYCSLCPESWTCNITHTHMQVYIYI